MRNISLVMCALAGLALAVPAAAPANAATVIIKKGDRGHHYGWERGRHYGWERGRHYGWDRDQDRVNRTVIIKRHDRD